eukprot:CAMPEP_0172898292 /NCGR_PEP_ID=MMETSP1075-20121228/159390_1 /TAXON_ID=2916 /ORGANISM="Ceratium fusus, Strain PA161109" /LENGTH=44 /DNA_ID= /DNA_START= /DNA_END= /DNA_ORIENTATION=
MGAAAASAAAASLCSLQLWQSQLCTATWQSRSTSIGEGAAALHT